MFVLMMLLWIGIKEQSKKHAHNSRKDHNKWGYTLIKRNPYLWKSATINRIEYYDT
jgi:hypothetical protein